jgi:outer membrane protein assembly factor BamB
LLFMGLGGCPQLLLAGQEPRAGKPLPAPLLPSEVAWTVELPSAPSAGAAMDGSAAYIPLQAGELISLDRETGVTRWSIQLGSMWPPVVDDEVVYVAGGDQLHAVRASDGTPVWSTLLTDVAAPLALQGDRLIALVEPDEVRAVRTSDGQELWRRSLGGSPGPAAIATDATSVCISMGGRLLRLALADGALQWQRDLPGMLSPPTLTNDRVFVGSTDNTFYAFHPETGRVAWRWRSGGDVVGSVSDDRFVYVVSLDNLLRALRRSSGNQVWKRELSTRATAPPDLRRILVLSETIQRCRRLTRPPAHRLPRSRPRPIFRGRRWSIRYSGPSAWP